MTEYTNIATFTYPSEIAVVRSLLESNGIECIVKDELTVQVHNFYSNAIGGIRLAVPTENIEEAVGLLNVSGFEEFTIDHKKNENITEKKSAITVLKVSIYLVSILGILAIALSILATLYYG